MHARRADADQSPLPGSRFVAVEGRFYESINDELLAGKGDWRAARWT
jgi:hypothetical protein